MEFTKAHGLGNDFIIINAFVEKITDPNLLAVKMCNRHFGVGADGLILVHPSDKADFRMQIINSDGSEADMCGNGVRCFAMYVFEKGLTDKKRIEIETLSGIVIPEIIDANKGLVEVDMGIPRFSPEEIPMNIQGPRVINKSISVEGTELEVTALSMGNPHCVIFVDDINRAPVTTLGPKLEKHEIFPKKTNVEFVEVVNGKEIKMHVWERGAGETMACGTGACASTVAAILNGYTEKDVIVHLKGGDLRIQWHGERVFMTGPAVEVFSGKINPKIFNA
jgi:diaminopimelate epimerase